MSYRRLRLLGDRILIKFLQPKPNSVIIDIHREREAREAAVLQVGNGRYVGNTRIPVDVRPGDVVCVMPQLLKTKQTMILRQHLLEDDEAIVHEADVLYVKE